MEFIKPVADTFCSFGPNKSPTWSRANNVGFGPVLVYIMLAIIESDSYIMDTHHSTMAEVTFGVDISEIKKKVITEPYM